MITEQVEIINKLGLHARASAKLVNVAGQFSSKIDVELGSQRGDAKSIMAMMMLAASKGTKITLHADGTDEQEAIAALKELINNYFDEEE